MSKQTPPNTPPAMMAIRSAARLITPTELVSRWRGAITLVTLATWRSRKQGPPYVKIGGRESCYGRTITDAESAEWTLETFKNNAA